MGKDDAVEQTFGVTGFDILSGGQKPNAGLSFIKLKPWDEKRRCFTGGSAYWKSGSL